MHIMLFGGSFDPPHNGHATVVNEILKERLADKLWYVPCAKHPFNKHISETEHRLAMVQMILVPHTQALTYEADKNTVSYSIETLRAMQKKFPQHTFSWLIGSDQLADFHKWKLYKELLNEFRVYVYPRKGFPFKPMYAGMVPLHHVPTTDISSTQVRQYVSKQQDIFALVDPRVAEYIAGHRLYTV